MMMMMTMMMKLMMKLMMLTNDLVFIWASSAGTPHLKQVEDTSLQWAVVPGGQWHMDVDGHIYIFVCLKMGV